MKIPGFNAACSERWEARITAVACAGYDLGGLDILDAEEQD
jgi:hypothetical protein